MTMVTDTPRLRDSNQRPGVLPVTAVRPVERYGAPRPWMRPAVLVGSALLGLLFLAWLVWAGLHHAQPAVAERLRAYRVLDDSTVSATIDIERRPGVGVVCLLEAQAADHFVVGERRVHIPPGPEPALTRTYRITTERPATNAVLDSCSPTR